MIHNRPAQTTRPNSEPFYLPRVATVRVPGEEHFMDKDRVKGSAQQAKGKLKETAGKVSGDSKLQGEGKADQAAGKVRNTIGGIKDTLKGK
jgi:uncharacterized protein YjbJ (UPF0337 family)